ncbi:MAG: GNAT family N-acetyltransferase [Chloroflexia bacterium]|nr:GNAT family N-acetyltransferase [Chloroflexia bacterium]
MTNSSEPILRPQLRLATEADLAELKALPFSGGLPSKHDSRYARQLAGEVVYLLALIDDEIVGHLLLKWNGPEHPRVRSLAPSCAEIEDFVVKAALRGRGIGSAMLDHAATLCLNRGVTRLGLGVGLGNPTAHDLYERRGFALVPNSEHRVTWLAPDSHGREFEEHDDCVYLLTELS